MYLMAKVFVRRKLQYQKSIYENILLIRLDSGLGDAILNTIFLHNIRRKYPKAHITIVVLNCLKKFYLGCPWVNSIITTGVPPKNTVLKMIWAISFGKRISSNDYDLAISLRYDKNDNGAAWLCFGCGAEERFGFIDKNDKSDKYKELIFTSILKTTKKVKHEALRIKDGLTAMGIKNINMNQDLWIRNTELENAKKYFDSRVNKEKKFVIALGIGAGLERRQWPIENYSKIIKNFDAQYIIICSEKEKKFGEYLEKNNTERVITVNELELREKIVLMKYIDLFIGNDSGPMHIASALKKPVIEISCHPKKGSNDHYNSPKRFGPWSKRNVIILQPEGKMDGCERSCEKYYPHCILEITAEEVIKAIKRIWK
jgi:heptosyltransferase-2